jgi:hypothetical protein
MSLCFIKIKRHKLVTFFNEKSLQNKHDIAIFAVVGVRKSNHFFRTDKRGYYLTSNSQIYRSIIIILFPDP